MNETSQSFEIDLLRLIDTILQGKWKIIVITATCVVGVFGFHISAPAPSFVATTEIRPISSKEADQYVSLNSLGFFTIAAEDLLLLYNERLSQPEVLAKILMEQSLIDRSEFGSEDEYEFAVKAFSSGVSLLPPGGKGNEIGASSRNWTLAVEYNDEDKWLSALEHLHRVVTEEVLEIYRQRFSTLVSNKRLKREFELEDISTQIDNILADYDTKTSNRLAFLSEQALIARALGVTKDTTEVQSGFMSNVKIDTPCYLRGYNAIEKEIEIISSRKNKRAFVTGLLKLEQEKRALEQDRTLQRLEELFAETPLMKPGEFSAASLIIETTNFRYKSRPMLMFVLATAFGGMIGTVYVLIASALRSRRASETG